MGLEAFLKTLRVMQRSVCSLEADPQTSLGARYLSEHLSFEKWWGLNWQFPKDPIAEPQTSVLARNDFY